MVFRTRLEFQNRKRYGGMRDCSPCRGLRNATNFGLLESVLEKPAVRLRSPKKLSVEFHKSSEFVELARSFRFGKCLAKTASLRKLETLSKILIRQTCTTLSAEMQEKISTFEAGGKFFDTLKNHIAGIFVAVFAIKLCHIFFVAIAKNNASVVVQAAFVGR